MLRNLPANARDTANSGLIPELGRSPGEGNDTLLQYSYLENSDRGTWQATVNGATESDMMEQHFLSFFLGREPRKDSLAKRHLILE